ncbi:cytochrome C biogenesis protein [Halomicrobium sp. IBSBa]|uniref:cytochrome c biogenesis CcdA family protein n=1 Tax=Halomicrobium sp. IBSBa TaxID=2778916 RepID=UPI001ABFE265|nr:cytochrome c biogenesis protein CcdA [Halomicrobium sp. IBSBa]MBO4246971.1 cytochrome C biogenesis protein [Halomicrobium sp. IBSBa]
MSDIAVAGVLAFAAGAGISTFFAPCAFPLLPGYVGYYVQRREGSGPTVAAAAVAGLGALGSLSVVAALVLAVGEPIKRTLPVFEPLVGVALVGFGATALLGRGPELRIGLPRRPRSLLGFGLFGAIYAVAAAGCVVPLLVGVVTQALAFESAISVLVVAVYALGVTLPLVGVTLLAGVGVDLWHALGTHTGRIQQAAAVVMILAGLGQLALGVSEVGVV